MTNMDNDIIEIYFKLISRYKGLIKFKNWDSKYEKTSRNHIYKMLSNMENCKTIDKMAKFIEFIQEILSSFGIINVNEERLLTKKLFKNVYKQYNII